MNTPSKADVHERVRPLLARLGLPPAHHSTPLHGGANNRVYRIFAGDADLVLKQYYFNDGGTRRRVVQDFALSKLLWDAGIEDVPQPLVQDEAGGLNLFTYVEGARLEPGAIGAHEVELALQFFRALQRCAGTAEAKQLAAAKEACFTTIAHLDTVDRRAARLLEIEIEDDLDAEVVRFVSDELTPTWLEVQHHSGNRLAGLSRSENPLTEAEYCLSPSDFGFHNALRRADGGLTFFDFEYAGWDDPAKLVCDFFCQIQVPVPMEFFLPFARSVAATLHLAEHHVERMFALLPVHRLKWACLVLNEFLEEPMLRRFFAQPGVDAGERKRQQLAKAVAILAQVRANPLV